MLLFANFTYSLAIKVNDTFTRADNDSLGNWEFYYGGTLAHDMTGNITNYEYNSSGNQYLTIEALDIVNTDYTVALKIRTSDPTIAPGFKWEVGTNGGHDEACGMGIESSTFRANPQFGTEYNTNYAIIAEEDYYLVAHFDLNGDKVEELRIANGTDKIWQTYDISVACAEPITGSIQRIFSASTTFNVMDNLIGFGGTPSEVNWTVYFNLTTPAAASIDYEDPTPPDAARNNTLDITINISCNSDDISINWNGTTVGSSEASPFNFTLNSTLVPQEGTYSYNASCNGADTATRTWTYDITEPSITINPTSSISSDNTTTIERIVPFILNISVEDNESLGEMEVLISDTRFFENIYFNYTNSSMTGTSWTYYNVSDIGRFFLGEYYLRIQSADSHTTNKIKDYAYLEKNSELLYFTTEGSQIGVYSEDTSTTKTYKKTDRYEFEFEFEDVKAERTFNLVSYGNELRYIQDSKYKGHFIVTNRGEFGELLGNWIDFEGGGEVVSVKQKKDGKYQDVTYYEIKVSNADKKIKFNSIGGLNVNEVIVQFNVTTNYTSDAYLVIGNTSGGTEWNITPSFNETNNVTLNATKLNDILNDGCICEGCNLVGSDCDIPFTWFSRTPGIIQYSDLLIEFEFGIDNCTDFNYTILNVSYFDQASGASINVTNNYDLTFTGLFSQNVNGTFTGGYSNAFCTNVAPDERILSWDVSGQFTLNKSDYATTIYDIDAGEAVNASNRLTQNLSLYMIRLNDSTTVQFTWLTTAYQPVNGIQEIYECVGDGTRILVQSIPIIDSIAYGNIELLTKSYSYEVIIGGVRYTDSNGYSKCHIEAAEEVQFLVDVTTTATAPIVGFTSVQCNVTRTGNNTVKVAWGTNPDNPDDITGCIYADRLSIGGPTNFYINCTSVTNSIERTVPNSGFNYVVRGRVFQSGLALDCPNTVEFNFNNDTADSLGLMGVFSVFLL